MGKIDTSLIDIINEKRRQAELDEIKSEDFKKKSEKIIDNLLKKSLKEEKQEYRRNNNGLSNNFKKKAIITICVVGGVATAIIGSHKLKENDRYTNYMRTINILANEELATYTEKNEFAANYNPDRQEIIEKIDEVMSTIDKHDYNLSGYGEEPEHYVGNSGVSHMEQNAINILAQDELDSYENGKIR